MIKVYPAIFSKDKEETDPKFDDYYLVTFPDLYGMTQGENLENAMEMASDYLGIVLADYIENGEELPTPTPINDIELPDKDSIKTLVSVDVSPYLNGNHLENVNTKIPKWLKNRAKKEHINFSKTLSDALLNKLGY